MVADFAELHEEVHERSGSFCVSDMRGLLYDVGNGQVGTNSTIQRPLPRAESYVDVDLNLEVCQPIFVE